METPGLSLIVPAYNEADRLPPTLALARSYFDGRGQPYEILVVDDGSEDDTATLVETTARHWPQLQLLTLKPNRGKGAAVQAGMLRARGALRLFSDADLSTPLSEMDKLEQAIQAGAGIAIGSRGLPGSQVERHQPKYRELMGKAYNLALRRLVLPQIHDSQCGFKMFTSDAALLCFSTLHCGDYGFDAEVLCRARDHGITVAEVPVVWRHASGTRVSSFSDGARMLVDLVRLRRRLRQPRLSHDPDRPSLGR